MDEELRAASTETTHAERPPPKWFARLNRFFKLTENGTTVRIELAAGLTTFLTMA